MSYQQQYAVQKPMMSKSKSKKAITFFGFVLSLISIIASILIFQISTKITDQDKLQQRLQIIAKVILGYNLFLYVLLYFV